MKWIVLSVVVSAGLAIAPGDAHAREALGKSAKGHPAVKTSADDNKSLVKWILAM